MAENEETVENDAQAGAATDTADDTAGEQDTAKDAAKGDEGSKGDSTSFDDLLASLDDDHRSAVERELKSRDRELRKARNEARNLRDRVREAEPKAAEAEERKGAEEKVAELNATLKAESEGLRHRLVAETVRASAAARFTDPGDAVAFLDPTSLLDDDLEPDQQAIADALDDLLERKPHLAKADPRPRPPAANRSQGTSGNPAPSIDSQVAEARKAGDHALAVRLEMQKLGVATLK